MPLCVLRLSDEILQVAGRFYRIGSTAHGNFGVFGGSGEEILQVIQVDNWLSKLFNKCQANSITSYSSLARALFLSSLPFSRGLEIRSQVSQPSVAGNPLI
jgi:hypothetical protein